MKYWTPVSLRPAPLVDESDPDECVECGHPWDDEDQLRCRCCGSSRTTQPVRDLLAVDTWMRVATVAMTHDSDWGA